MPGGQIPTVPPPRTPRRRVQALAPGGDSDGQGAGSVAVGTRVGESGLQAVPGHGTSQFRVPPAPDLIGAVATALPMATDAPISHMKKPRLGAATGPSEGRPGSGWRRH